MKLFVVSTVSAGMLIGCATLKPLEPYVGPIAGGVTAGALCNAYFAGKNQRALATTLCAAGGALIGKVIQEKLKESEKPALSEATYHTLETGQRQTVRTAEGTTIITEPVRAAPPPPAPAPPPVAEAPAKRPSPPAKTPTPKKSPASTAPAAKPQAAPAPSPAPASTVASTGCGTVKQTIVLKNNERYEDTVTACKKDGVWVG